MSNITNEQQKLSRVLSNTLNRMKVKTGDVFIVARIRALATFGKIEVTGDWQKGWKDISLKFADGPISSME
jgi:hypothetical protein